MTFMRDLTNQRLDQLIVPQVGTKSNLPILSNLNASFSVLDIAPPVLDLNYADKQALYGFETFTRSTTESYTDVLGNAQSAAINVPAFDRGSILGWSMPLGLKLTGDAKISFNPVNILPVTGGYTIVVDVVRPVSFANSGNFLNISDGTSNNRVLLGVNSSYQPYFAVSAAGAVVVNQAMGDIQNWYGESRRMVLTVNSGAFYYSDGSRIATVNTGTAPLANTRTLLEIGGTGFSGWIQRVRLIPMGVSQATAFALAGGPSPLALWGDSLTFGTGGNAVGNYPEVLRNARTPRSGVYNGGVGGETSTQIKVRQLADNYRNDWTNVIWVGRNNPAVPSVVVGDIAEMVAKLTHKRFLIMSVINKADGTEPPGSALYNQIAATNAAIQAAWPNNYLDIRSLIVAASAGTNDSPNPTWSSDGLHLNNTGYAYVAQQVGAWLRAKRWY